MLSFLRSRKQALQLLLVDLIFFVLSFSAAYSLRLNSSDIEWAALSIVIAINILSLYLCNAYFFKPSIRRTEFVKRLLFGLLLGFVATSVYVFLVGRAAYTPIYGRGVLFGGLLLFYALALAVRWFLFKRLVDLNFSPRWLYFGDTAGGEALQAEYERSHYPGTFVIVDGGVDSRAALRDIYRSEHWSGVIFSHGSPVKSRFATVFVDWRFEGTPTFSVTEFYERYFGKEPLDELSEGWFLEATGFVLADTNLYVRLKRVADVLLASFLLVVFSPLMLLVALVVRLDSPGAVLYRQLRIGQGGRRFEVVKFRTMRRDAERDGARWAQTNDARITRCGRWLRRTRLDELPQLVNVLSGQMSLIGPRPERPEFVDHLNEQIPFYNLRHSVRPGISGWAQVSYPYGQTVDDARQKLQYDLYYIKHYSPLLDLLIVFRTLRTVLSASGQ
ncbi:sugar transferase [Gammaproteobacteria bacterium]|nr:sugar transferase [Gammaproteobacteria bacterium]